MATTMRHLRTVGKMDAPDRISRTGAEAAYLWITRPPAWPEAEPRRIRDVAAMSCPSLAAYAAHVVSAMRTDVLKATTRLPGGASPLIYKVRSGQRLLVEPLVGVALETVRRDPVRADHWADFALHLLNLLSRARTEDR